MVSAFQVLAAALCWTVFAFRVRDLRRRPWVWEVRAVALAIGALALAVTVQLDAVYLTLDRYTVPGMGTVLGDCLALLATVVAQTVPLNRTSPDTRPIRIRLALVVGAIALMIVLFVTTPSSFQEMAATRHSAQQVPMVSAFSYVYVIAIAAAMAGAMHSSWRYSRVAEKYSQRWGFALLTAGSAMGFVYAVTKFAYMVGYETNVRIPGPYGQVGEVTAGLAAVLGLIGATMPAWGPKAGLESLGQRLNQAITYHRLTSLWQALCSAEPGVVLGRVSLDLALYRRIIEIWDARLRLRDHFDPAVRDHDWPDDATREAAMLAIAIRAHHHGITFPATPTDDPPDDVGRLVRVAHAFRRSSLVAAAVRDAERRWATTRSNANQ